MKKRELCKILKANNYELIRTNKHLIYSNGNNTIAVPNHNGCDLNGRLVSGILKQIKTGKQL
jgi:predicted RNA binding protein YcfA (HicA-like mRNA interferase family)